jgi:hypothetical protein
MKYFAFIIPVFLSGCFHQTVNSSDIATAIKACGGLDKIQEIQAIFTGSEVATCTNRTSVWLNEQAWAK